MIDAAVLSRLTLFSEVDRPSLALLAEQLEEASYGRDTRVLREGISGGSFFVITNGEVSVRVDGVERARLSAGDFFGEISLLTGERVVADVVVASEELRCAVLPGHELRPLLLAHPTVAIRMLEMLASRLRTTTLWSE